MKYKKRKSLIVLLVLCIFMSSCESFVDFYEQLDFEYVLSAAFENKSDEDIFVARLNAIGCTVLSSQEKEECVEYTLKAKDFIQYSEFDLLCQNYSFEIYDNNGNELLTRENVISASGLIILYVNPNEEALQKIRDDNVKEMIFKLDGVEHKVDVNLIEETLWISQHPDIANDVLLKAIVFFSSNDISGSVHIENVKRTK